MRYLYTVILTPFEDGRGYEARVPDIDSCVTSGRDLPDALDMIQDAASLMLVTMEDERMPIPSATAPENVIVPAGSVASLISIDTDRYRMMTNTRAVRKNVSLPAWMAAMADQRGVNCSQVLQDALRAMFQ